MDSDEKRQIYRFDDVVIDAERGTVIRDGVELPLRTKSFQVLIYLIENRSQDLEKDKIIRDVWKDTAVVDDVLVQSVKDIRRALDDDPHHPRFIRTLPKHGYRFIGELTEREKPSESLSATNISNTPPALGWLDAIRQRSILVLLSLFVLISIVLGFAGQRLWHVGTSATGIGSPQNAGKRPLVVMFFENRSGRADLEWLSEGLTDMLSTGLSRLPNLAVISRGQLHTLLERAKINPAAIGLPDSLDVARQTGAEFLITGSFTSVGEKVRIEVQIYDGAAGELVAAESLTVDRAEQILTEIDMLSIRLARNLHKNENPASISTLAEITTDNLEAYRLYSLAVEKANSLHNAEAIQMLEKATALDPNFAMAHARIGYAYAVTGNEPDKGKPHLAKAFQLSARLTERDRLNIAGWYAIANKDYQNAIDQFRQIVAAYPHEIEAHYRLARLLLGEGKPEEAVNVLRRGLTVDPDAKTLYNGLGGMLSFMGQHEEAIAAHQHFIALAPNEPNAYDSLGMTYQWSGDYASAIANYERALELNPDFEVAVIHLANTRFQIGQYQKALDLYRRYIDKAPSTAETARGYASIALLHLKKGDLVEAENAAREVYKIKKESALVLHIIAVEKNGRASSSELEERFFADYLPFGRGGPNSRRLELYYRGYFALKKGLSDEALGDFQEAVQNPPQPWDIDAYEDCLANAFLELGRPSEAAAEYRRILLLNQNYPLAAYHLGQAYQQLGDNERARQSYLQFLESWKNADADLSEVTLAQKFVSKN